MAGHSKWANIKHRKGKQDAKRGKLYTKLIREITVAAKLGGADPGSNPRLRTAIDKALIANMTKDVIDRAAKRGAGGMEGGDVEEIRYEGYGPNGVAVMVDCMTNNRNRTVSEVRHAFTKCGGNLGTDGSVAYLFHKKGQLTFAPGSDEEKIMETAIDAGADDVVVNEDESIDIVTSPDHFESVRDQLRKGNLKPVAADVTMVADTYVDINEKDSAEKLMRLIDMLEDLDDVQEVFSNANIEESLLEEI